MIVAAVVLAGMMALAVTTPYTFCWDGSTGAVGYRLYWSTVPDAWPSERMTQTPSTCVEDHAPDPAPGELLYYVVTAYSQGGESETEHGQII